jgi:hypothetical protein
MLDAQFPHFTCIFPPFHLLQRLRFPHQSFAVKLLHLFVAAAFARAKVDGFAVAARETD